LAGLLDRLQERYGAQRPPPAKTAFEHVLWENVAYLVSDERRKEAFRALVKQVGRTPAAIRAASREALLDVTARRGMHPERRVMKLIDCADIAFERHGGKLETVLVRPAPEARRALQRFPGIGQPGAEKIPALHRRAPLPRARVERLARTRAPGLGRGGEELLGDVPLRTSGRRAGDRRDVSGPSPRAPPPAPARPGDVQTLGAPLRRVPDRGGVRILRARGLTVHSAQAPDF